jgi:hypothetical protein
MDFREKQIRILGERLTNRILFSNLTYKKISKNTINKLKREKIVEFQWMIYGKTRNLEKYYLLFFKTGKKLGKSKKNFQRNQSLMILLREPYKYFTNINLNTILSEHKGITLKLSIRLFLSS